MREKKHVNVKCIIMFILMLVSISDISNSVFLKTIVHAETEKKDTTKEKERFTLDSKARIGNFVRLDNDVEIVTTVTNNEGDFSGYIQIIMINDDYSKNVMYQSDLVIAAGETKTIGQKVRWIGSGNRMMVRITDKKENIIEKKKVKVSLITAEDSLIGILTDDKQNLGYWDSEQVAYLKKEDISSAYAMGVMDVLIINNFNTGDLEKEQYEAIKEWIELGGTLVLGTGEQVNRTLAMFQDDYLAGKIGNVDNEIADISFQEEKVISDLAEDMVLHKINKGLGVICVADKDLGIDKSRWNKKGYEYISAIQSQYSAALQERLEEGLNGNYGYSYYTSYGGNSILRGADEIPSIKNYAIMLSIYIVIVTIVVYLVLKKKDKLEWTWGIVPVVGFIFAGVIVAMGNKTRITGTYMNYTKQIEFQEEDNPAVNNITYMDIASSNNSKYELAVPEDMDVYAKSSTSYYDGDVNNDRYEDYDIGFKNKNGKNIIEFKNNQAFGTTKLVSKNVEMINGTYQSDISYLDAKISGTFTNQTKMTIKNAIFWAEGKMFKLGTINPGEKVEITDKTLSKTYTYGYGQDSDLYEIAGIDTNREKWTLEEARYISALDDVFRENYNTEVRRGMIYGYIDANDDVMKESWGINCYGISLVRFPIQVNYKAKDGSIYVPDIVKEGQVIKGSYDASERNMDFKEDFVIEYTLDKNEQLTGIYFSKLLNPSIDSKVAIDYPSAIYEGEIKVYNWKTKKYEVIFEADKEGEVTDVEDYIGKDNAIRFLMEADNTKDLWIYVPVISLTKEVKQNG